MEKPKPPHMGKSYFRSPPQEYLTQREEVYRQEIYDDSKIELPVGFKDTEFYFVKEWDRYNKDYDCYIIGYKLPGRNPNYESELARYTMDKATHDEVYDNYEFELKIWEKEQRRLQYESLKKEFEL